ncbi:hypothetical protein ACQ4PT_050565 [Festuca glaucescens]
MGDHYQTLGLQRDASKADIKNAYFRLAHRYHPDHHNHADAAARAEAARRFRQAKDAYDVLSDGQRRADYDRNLCRSSYSSSSGYRTSSSSSVSSSSSSKQGNRQGGASSSSSSSSTSSQHGHGGSRSGPRPPRPRGGSKLQSVFIGSRKRMGNHGTRCGSHEMTNRKDEDRIANEEATMGKHEARMGKEESLVRLGLINLLHVLLSEFN